MPIRARTLLPDSITRYGTKNVLCWYPNGNAAYIMTATAGSAMQAFPFALTLAETIMRLPHSICITQSAGAGVFTVTFVGENQFGEPISETISTTGASDTIHTANCYRKLTSATVTAAPNTAVTISLGSGIQVTGNGVPKVPLPFKPTSLASIRSVAMVNAGPQPTFTKVGAPNWVISIAANPIAGNPVGCLILNVDEEDAQA